MFAIEARNTALRIVNSTVSGAFIPEPSGGVVFARPGAKIWLQGTSVHGNKAVLPLVASTDTSAGDGAIYSDHKETAFLWTSDGALERQITGQPPPDKSAFLSAQDEWFLRAVAVRNILQAWVRR